MTDYKAEPGIYRHMPEAVYHALPYASNSRLSRAASHSWAHVRHEMDHPIAPTPAMRKGSALHMALLEPERFGGAYVVPEQCIATTSKGTRCSNTGAALFDEGWVCGVHSKKAVGTPVEAEVMTLADMTDVQGMREAVLSHPTIGPLFEMEGENELTIIWDEEVEGGIVRCKARIDRRVVHPAAGAINIDVKTTSDARTHGFQRSVVERGYFRQHAMYRRACEAHGLEVAHLVYVAVESAAPYAVKGYRLADDAAQLGDVELDGLLHQWYECQATGIWPGYGDRIEDITLPAWVWREIEEVGV